VAPIPSVHGILESSLYVDNIERSTRFYQSLLDCEVLFRDDRMTALNVANRQVLLLFKKHSTLDPIPTPGGSIPPHDGDGNVHLAFAIDTTDVALWGSRLSDRSVLIESVVRWPAGGTSVYFRDPDNHLIELATPGLWTIY
jgi:catechol 2,3-dioxygenase-like lactoylglutathione lyase family enzyme